MSGYYLMAQLPSLDGVGEILPITWERFYELCSRFLSGKALAQLEKLTLSPDRNGEAAASQLVAAWNEGERQLRLALAKARAQKLNKSFHAEVQAQPAELAAAAGKAVSLEDPMEAELFLNRIRLAFLETLRPMDSFCEDAVFYYGLKLKLLQRIGCFDRKAGEDAYHNIYQSILDGDRREATQ